MTCPAVTEGRGGRNGFLNTSEHPLIVEAVVRHSDHNTRLALRRTCKSLQAVVDPYLKKARAVVKFGIRPFADRVENYGIVDVYSDQHRIPALYNFRDVQAASLHTGRDLQAWGMFACRLLTMADAPAFIFRGSLLNVTTAKFASTSQDILEQAIARVRGCIERDIHHLHIDVKLPKTKVIFLRDIRTVVIESGTWLCSDGWSNALVCTKNVAKVVLIVHFHPSGTCFDMDTPAEWPAPWKVRSVAAGDTPPALVVIFQAYSSAGTPIGHKVIDRGPGELGWLLEMVGGIIGCQLQSVTFVDFVEKVDPGLLGLGRSELSREEVKKAFVETACRNVELWDDGTFPGNPGWTQASAKATIKRMQFLAADQYRQLVGAEQYDLETNCEAEDCLIDHLAYPHIVDAIIQHSDHNTRLAIRQTCKSLCAKTEEYFAREHVVVHVHNDCYEPVEMRTGWSGGIVLDKVWTDSRGHLHPRLYNIHHPNGWLGDYVRKHESVLQMLSKTQVVDIIDSFRICFCRPNRDFLGPVVNFVRRSTGRDIPTLRFDVKTPLSGTVRGPSTIVLWGSEAHDEIGFPSIDTDNVSKVVINIPYSRCGSSDRPPGPPNSWTPGRLNIGCHMGDCIPDLVAILKSYQPGASAAWFDHFTEQLIRNCHVRIILVNALDIPPCVIGLDDDHGLSDQDFKQSFIAWTCVQAEKWSDGHFHPHWTQARALEAIRRMSFYTPDEYIGLVGEEQWIIETREPGVEHGGVWL